MYVYTYINVGESLVTLVADHDLSPFHPKNIAIAGQGLARQVISASQAFGSGILVKPWLWTISRLKTMGKPWEKHGKMVIHMENHHFYGKIMGRSIMNGGLMVFFHGIYDYNLMEFIGDLMGSSGI